LSCATPILLCLSFSAACQPGWKRFGEGCYKSVGSLGYKDGADTCRMQGAEIYGPTSKEEAYWVMSAFGYVAQEKNIPSINYKPLPTPKYCKSPANLRARFSHHHFPLFFN